LAKLLHFLAKAPKLGAFFAGQTVRPLAIINLDLLDPAMNGRGTGFKLPRQTLHAAPSSCQRNNLIPEFRRVRVPRSRHEKHSPSSSEKCPRNRGNSNSIFHIDIAELRTAEGKLYLFVAIDRTSKFAVARLVDKADRRTAWKLFSKRCPIASIRS